MEVVQELLDGVLVLKPKIFGDERGYFYESFNKEKFKELSEMDLDFVQDNQSKSQKGVLRGLHFQQAPFAQGKLVRVIQGSVLDVAVDVRKNSKSYGKTCKSVLSAENHLMMWVPPGFAHGFLALENETIFQYKCTNFYNKESEGSILWNDDDLGIEWKYDEPIVSEKDMVAPKFQDLLTTF